MPFIKAFLSSLSTPGRFRKLSCVVLNTRSKAPELGETFPNGMATSPSSFERLPIQIYRWSFNLYCAKSSKQEIDDALNSVLNIATLGASHLLLISARRPAVYF